ncbi:hypothetical protein [Flavobacterium sp.]|uniref:hypothetical protein n=1 Tax=Flavobacterium sp. TaxID=239 RepID=UPI00261B408D|nr:hypothetical protein [Flavobacterium sp.]
MKTKKNEQKKFKLEKFEVAKLKNLHFIKGGVGETPITGEDPGEITKDLIPGSSQYCK